MISVGDAPSNGVRPAALEEDDAERKQIRALVDRAAEGLFRGHVRRWFRSPCPAIVIASA